MSYYTLHIKIRQNINHPVVKMIFSLYSLFFEKHETIASSKLLHTYQPVHFCKNPVDPTGRIPDFLLCALRCVFCGMYTRINLRTPPPLFVGDVLECKITPNYFTLTSYQLAQQQVLQ